MVVGAGPAGALAALRLAREGIDVVLLDGGRRRRRTAETLSPEGRGFLAKVGLWDRLPPGAVVECPAVLTSWEHPTLTTRTFLTHPYGCAWHVERRQFDAWLINEAREAGVAIVEGIAKHVTQTAGGWQLELRDDLVLVASYLIIAVGRISSFASTLGEREPLDGLCLVGGFTQRSATAGSALLVEAGPCGWWYSLPTLDGQLFAGWITDASLLKGADRGALSTRALDAAPFTRARMSSPLRIEVSPAPSVVRMASAGTGWIAVGDAALARDPLSGEGIAAAMHSGWEGAGAIIAASRGEAAAWNDAAVRGRRAVRSYLSQRAAAYRSQPRWLESPFWMMRRAVPS